MTEENVTPATEVSEVASEEAPTVSKAKKSPKKTPKKKKKGAKSASALLPLVTGPPTSKKKSSAINMTVKLSNILLPEDWNREALGNLSGLKASIKDNGQLIPLLVRKSDKDGKVVLVDGRRRFAALQELKINDAVVSYTEVDGDAAAFLQSMATNLAREDNTPYEIALSFGKLTEDYGFTNERIAKACGITSGYVSQHLAVLKASKKLQQALRKGTVSLFVFRYFSKLDPVEDATIYAKLEDYAIAGATAQEVGDKIDIYLQKKKEKAAAAAKKEGKTTAPAKARGAAAHKDKGGKKSSRPAVKLTDYSDPEVQKLMKPASKSFMIERVTHYSEQLPAASSANKKAYLQGLVDGIEEALGMVVYE